jgi:hypothetical protein
MTWQSKIKTKAQYKREAIGRPIQEKAFEPGPFSERRTGLIAVCGPVPYHTWYAEVKLDENGTVVKIK